MNAGRQSRQVLVAVAAILILQCARQTQNSVQIEVAAQAELVARRGESGNVARYQFAIVAGDLLGRAIHGESQIDVPADEVVLEHLAQLHFQCVKALRQPQLHIEKPMIDALDGERVIHLLLGAALHAALNPRKSGHGINRHACYSSTSNKNSGSRMRSSGDCASGRSRNCN